ncbi:hypothetical protein DFH11DRAFT_1605848 [Phellopilus nigrolimitatus]|nr:hypothetical protein DFH11DRAFT_1605848 [Phellopilus nigrolimitatus]
MALIRSKRAMQVGTLAAGVPKGKYRKRSRATPPGKCHSCNIRETPEWRRGPDGARTLCNACGLHYAKLLRKRDKAASTDAAAAALEIDMETLRASTRAQTERDQLKAEREREAQIAQQDAEAQGQQGPAQGQGQDHYPGHTQEQAPLASPYAFGPAAPGSASASASAYAGEQQSFLRTAHARAASS